MEFVPRSKIYALQRPLRYSQQIDHNIKCSGKLSVWILSGPFDWVYFKTNGQLRLDECNKNEVYQQWNNQTKNIIRTWGLLWFREHERLHQGIIYSVGKDKTSLNFRSTHGRRITKSLVIAVNTSFLQIWTRFLVQGLQMMLLVL